MTDNADCDGSKPQVEFISGAIMGLKMFVLVGGLGAILVGVFHLMDVVLFESNPFGWVVLDFVGMGIIAAIVVRNFWGDGSLSKPSGLTRFVAIGVSLLW